MKLWILKFKQWWAKRSYLKIRLISPGLMDHKASRTALECLLTLLDETQYLRYAQEDGMGVEFIALYKTIDEYRQEMKSLGLRLMNDQMIQTSWADQTPRTVKLNEFLISKEGFYINVAEAVHGFKHEALILCALMQKSDQAQWGVHEHNRRMMLKFFANLRTLTVSLIDVSFTLSPHV